MTELLLVVVLVVGIYNIVMGFLNLWWRMEERLCEYELERFDDAFERIADVVELHLDDARDPALHQVRLARVLQGDRQRDHGVLDDVIVR